MTLYAVVKYGDSHKVACLHRVDAEEKRYIELRLMNTRDLAWHDVVDRSCASTDGHVLNAYKYLVFIVECVVIGELKNVRSILFC